MPKEHIEIRCPHCGGKMLINWPTPRERGVQVRCSDCAKDFPVAEAVERTVAGAPDARDRPRGRMREDGAD